jgi:hypothetical protein
MKKPKNQKISLEMNENHTPEPDTNAPTETPNTKKRKPPIALIITSIIGGVCAILLVPTFFIPRPPEPTYQETNPNTEAVDTTRLELNSIQEKIKTLQQNMDKVFQNQVNLQTSLEILVQNQTKKEASIKENRKYITSLYQRILDLELQLQTLGGGFNMKRKTELQNIPTDSFP